MKKIFIAMAALACVVCSCSKVNAELNENEAQESVVYITLNDGTATRASGADHGLQAQDNTLNSLDILIFNYDEEGENYGMLDGYKRYSKSDLTTTSSLSVKATTGKKMIYAIANSHKDNWEGVMTLSEFQEQVTDLLDEGAKDFIMIGGKEETLQLSTSVSIAIRRMVARVQLNSVTAAFTGTPYEGTALEDVKAYLINVQGAKYIHNGEGDDMKLINSKRYVEADVQDAAMEGLLYDELIASLPEGAYNTKHYFYCYENNISEETDAKRYTRLVIEGKLNGTTYYYPVPIKQLKRNCCYVIDVKIQRPGSSDPDKDVELGTFKVSLNVTGWETTYSNNVEF